MTEPSRWGYLTVDVNVLKRMMHFPEGTEITGITFNDIGEATFFVTGPAVPAVQEGRSRRLTAVYSEDDGKISCEFFPTYGDTVSA